MHTFTITVKYFASIREALGCGSEEVPTSAQNLAALRDQLIARNAVYAAQLGRQNTVRMALNQTMCNETTLLNAGAEVAFFPPVTGG